ncbi:hypothetical protein LEP1GSC008_3960 [Leptospira kirschneri serovar Bulgarica str. Nikolaevo]|uniref:Uncharacterized protein n=2 Tax=Leptospira kirschneri TaxID=29507 RepID=M6F6N2_9LEPT|nr:hypothetical protein LEP1GSC008_3960 [Leptospira kirschneri serovar Bulgarica str. Nikolaevo]
MQKGFQIGSKIEMRLNLWELLHFIRIYLEDTLSLFKMPNCFKIFLRSLLKVIVLFRDFEQVFCKILT